MLYLKLHVGSLASSAATDTGLFYTYYIYLTEHGLRTVNLGSRIIKEKLNAHYETYRREVASELLSERDKHKVIRWKR